MLTPPPDTEPLPYRRFVAELLGALGRDPGEGVDPTAHLVDDLGLDSLEQYELQVVLEELCGCQLPTELLAGIDSLAAAYEWYRAKVGQERAPTAEPGTVSGARVPLAPGQVLLATRRTRLRPLEPPDYEWLHALTTRPENLVRWRDRGQTFRVEEWVERLWAGVAAQFAVVAVGGDGDGRPLGLVSLYNHDARNRHARIAAIFDDTDEAGVGWRLEGIGLLLNYAFEVFDLIKLYAEVVEFNLAAFASGEGRFFVEEGRLLDYEYAHGRHWSVHVLGLTRERFTSVRDEWLPRSLGDGLAGPPPPGQRPADATAERRTAERRAARRVAAR